MTCAACQNIIETEVRKLPGVKSAQVNVATELGEFEVEDNFDVDTFHALITKLGYKAISKEAAKDFENPLKKDILSTILVIVLASLVMFFSMVVMNNVIAFMLTTLIIIFWGKKYFFAVINFKSNMDTLIGLGVYSSYFYSCFLIFKNLHAHNYFEGAAFIIAFSRLGSLLDLLAKTKAKSDLNDLYKMQVKFASLIKENEIINTPVVDLKHGDIIRVKPGEKIPLDAVIQKGVTHADESMLTGESVPVAKNVNDKVFAGSVNLEGTIDIKIDSQLGSTFISGIIDFVEKAQNKKAPIQLYADRIVKSFVPVIVAIAVLSLVVWYFLTRDFELSLIHFISVLVIACPCALGLAVPMGIMVSTSAAAKEGLLISGGDIIEKAQKINCIIFDKTGTLTEGNPQVERLMLFDLNQNSENTILWAASCSQFSSHPLSMAIAEYAKKNNINLVDPDTFKNLPGLGLKATIGDDEFYLGNFDLMKQQNPEVQLNEDFYEHNIGSYVFILKNKQLIGVFIISDLIKKDAKEIVADLKNQEIEIFMVTGDHEMIAKDVAHRIGIKPENVYFNVKPIDKARILNELKEKNYKVAMVGDGINDAPALSKADLSLAMSNGSDIAIAASDVSVLNGHLESISALFKRAHKTMSVIKSNLLLSVIYNGLCIPLAAGVFYPFFKVSLSPMWASLAMALSSFSVIINSFRARKI